MFVFAALEATAAALEIAGTVTQAFNQEHQAQLQEINLRRQKAVAESQGAQVAIKQDKEMSHILSAEQVEAVNQGTTVGSFAAMTQNNMRNFAEDRKTLNTNVRLKEDILDANLEETKKARKQIPWAAALSIGTILAKTEGNFMAPQIAAGSKNPNAIVDTLYSNITGE